MQIQRSVLPVLLIAGVACAGGSSVDECVENLAQRQDRAVQRAATEADGIADTIEGALDVQKDTGLDQGQIRLLRRAQQQARDLQEDLDSTFGVGCD